MKWIQENILKILSSVKDLLPLERKMREDRVVVYPGPTGGGSIPKLNRPWKPFPNISKMQIKLAVHDWLLLLFGYYKRYLPSIEFWAWRNGKANSYIDYMFARLRTEVRLGKNDQAVKTMWILMRSYCYQVNAFNYVAKGWYKNMRFSEVMKTLRLVKQLCDNKSAEIDFKRVYLETPSKIRPLGVPTLPWRVYLHMYNNLITEWRMLTESGNQHAYLPGKGVITAWEDLLKKLDKAPNVYEADFKGFFDNIEHQGLTYVCLEDLNLPVNEVRFINALNQNLVKLTGEDKLIERDRKWLTTRSNGLGTIPGRFILFSDIARYFPNEIIIQGWDKTKATVWNLASEIPEIFRNSPRMVYVWIGKEYPIEQLKGKEIFANPWVKTVGVPQGAPTSCSLATLALRKLGNSFDIIAYADDVIYFPKVSTVNPIRILTDPEMGLVVNESKSQWAKREGKWLVDYVKFVGFKYYPARYIDTWQESLGFPTIMFLFIDLLFIHFPLFSLLWALIVLFKRYERGKPRFMASTRNGATLEFTEKESFLSYLNTGRTLLLNTYFDSKLSGESLTSWISSQMSSWAKLASPVKVITESYIKGAEVHHKRTIAASKLTDGPPVKDWVPHITLTGWFMARMQANSWDISVKQDFRLRWIDKSWLDKYWLIYAHQHGLNRKSINIFNASSLACDGLLNCKPRSKKIKVRWVLSSSRELKGWIKKLRETFYKDRL